MKEIKVLKNTIQEYAWGSFTAIPDLLGLKTPSDNPMAELWMGAHPKSPSVTDMNGKPISLIQLIENYPEDTLGKHAYDKFGNTLPYLFKVLAAEKPLSIQAHPDKLQAKEGFERENRQGIPLDAKNRNYRDANHKPECLCALTDFWALCGFRKVQDALSYLTDVCPQSLRSQLDNLYHQPDDKGLKKFFSSLMTLSNEKQREAVGEAVQSARRLGNKGPVFEWILKLHKEYSGDIGVLSPAFLNLICLKPGEALFLNAGELHAYLDGTGMELMANSDNVLRGGLTPKHVDVPELIHILTFEEKELTVIVPDAVGAFEKVYSRKAEEFVLSVISISAGETYIASPNRTAEILLCVSGRASIDGEKSAENISLDKGVSVFVPAAAGRYRIRGEVTIYKAAI
jgi:mannose-6-phosphate isomerase